MINKIYKNLTLFIYLAIFILSCDTRQPSTSDEEDTINVSQVQVWGGPVISIIDLDQDLEPIDINALPLDNNGSLLSDVTIGFQVLEGSPGFISDPFLTTDTTYVTTQFNIIPSAYLDGDGEFDFSIESFVRAYIDGQESIADTMKLVYQDEGISSDITALEIISVNPDSLYLGEQAEITALLSGEVDGINTGIEGKWISFESLVPDSQGEDGASLTFGEMNPELVETNEDGIAVSSFSPLNQTGFAQLRVSVANEPDFTDDTYLQVFSGEAISLELIIPTDNDLMVTGGGGNESVTISVEIKDGFGNHVDDDYAVIFTVPCPYPIDGSCPVGDGDYSNDIMLNGIPSNGTVPTAISYSTNGIANVTLNSGNRPGLVLIKAQLCTVDDVEDGICDNVLYEAERIAAAITTGPANYGQVVAGWTEADSTGGGVYSLPVTAIFWDRWTNPIADSTSVYWYINPEYIADVDPESKVGNCGNGEPGQACTNAYYTSGDIFSQGQICAKVSGESGSEVLACSGGARCEDFSEFNCLDSEDFGCIWNTDFGECYFIASEAYCNTIFYENQCTPSHENYRGYPEPYNCVWAPGAIAVIPEWQSQIADGANCHYSPLVNALDEQQFSFDANGDGYDDLFIGEWEAAGTITPDDPFCNIYEGMNAIQYQEYSDECESKSVCSWEFIAGDNSSEDGMIGTCVYNGGAGYYNPCVDCEISIIPLSPTVTDYCQTDDEPLDILIRGHLGDAYGDDVHLGALLMAVFDATAFNFISSEDTTIDEDMGYEFDPPILPSATQITDSNGEVYWIIRLPNDNCHNTNPDDPDVFSCDNIYFRAYLLDPLYGESVDLNTTLYKNCQP